jgi:ATP synthase protein I
MIDDYSLRVRRVIQWTVFVLAAIFLAWGYSPYPTWFAGMALGAFMALLSTVYTAWKVNRVGEMAIRTNGDKRRASLGTVTRFSMAVLATLIALRYPEQFHIVGMVIGLLIPSVIAWGDAVYFLIIDKKTGKG